MTVLFLLLASASVSQPRVLVACNAVSQADVEIAVGRRVSRGVESELPRGTNCDYTGSTGQVTVTMQRLTQDVDLASEMRSLREALPGSVVNQTEGFTGAQAFVVEIPGAGTQIHLVRGGRRHLLVSVLGFGETSRTVAEKLMRIARERTE